MEKAKSNVGAIVLAIIITAVVVGGGVYYSQRSTNAPQATLQEYFATRDQFINSEMTQDPDALGFEELANIAVTCPDSAGTPCGGNLLILSKDPIHSGNQEFYLAFTMGTGYTYFGPFTDDLQRIVDESKSIQSLEKNTVTTVETEKIYEDDYLSFEYPKNVELLFAQPSGGRSDSQTITFLVYDQAKNTYESANLSLTYMTALGESEESSFDSVDALIANYKEYNLETNEYTIDGRQAVQIITGDMTGETFFLVIPANESGDAYRLSGTSLNTEVKEILDLFVETAKLKQ